MPSLFTSTQSNIFIGIIEIKNNVLTCQFYKIDNDVCMYVYEMSSKYALLKQKRDELHDSFDDREIADMVSSLFTFIANNLEKGTSDFTPQIIEEVFAFCNTQFNHVNKSTCQTYIDGIKDKLWDDDAILITKLDANEVVGFGDFNLKAYMYYMYKNKRLSELKKMKFIKLVDLAIDCIESPELYNQYHLIKRLVHDVFEKSLFHGCPSLQDIIKSSESIDDTLKGLLISHDTMNNIYISKKNRDIER